MAAARLTHHARDQLEARSELSQEELLLILDQDLVVLIGQEPGTTHYHKVFYSRPDGNYFVVIQDNENGDVITILPPDYHNRWKISPETFVAARRLITG
ncbi:MAG: hypothetical protein WC517_00975 [Patescibacteria group bacterium]